MAWGDLIDPSETEPVDIPKERVGITIQEYNAVRALLLNTLTESEVPNEMIADKTYFGAALDEVNRLLGTNVPGETDTVKFDKYRTAVLLMTASFMCEAIAQLSSEGIAVIRRGFHDVDWASKEMKLCNRSLGEIAKLTPRTSKSGPQAERLSGTRGRW